MSNLKFGKTTKEFGVPTIAIGKTQKSKSDSVLLVYVPSVPAATEKVW